MFERLVLQEYNSKAQGRNYQQIELDVAAANMNHWDKNLAGYAYHIYMRVYLGRRPSGLQNPHVPGPYQGPEHWNRNRNGNESGNGTGASEGENGSYEDSVYGPIPTQEQRAEAERIRGEQEERRKAEQEQQRLQNEYNTAKEQIENMGVAFPSIPRFERKSLEEQVRILQEYIKICDDIKNQNNGRWDDEAQKEADRRINDFAARQETEGMENVTFWFDLIAGQKWALHEFVIGFLAGEFMHPPAALRAKVVMSLKTGLQSIGIGGDLVSKFFAGFAVGTTIFFAFLEAMIYVINGGDWLTAIVEMTVNIISSIFVIAGAAALTSLLIAALPALTMGATVINFVISWGLSKLMDLITPYLSQLALFIIQLF